MTDAGMVNVGQLVRERYGDGDTELVGCSVIGHGTEVDGRFYCCSHCADAT